MEYQLAQETWRSPSVVSIFSPDDRFLAEIPTSFLSRAGITTWILVMDILACILEPFDGGRLVKSTGELVGMEDNATDGDYILQVSCE